MLEKLESVDALYVINQCIDLTELGCNCVRRGHRRALIVSSHELFEEEIRTLREAARGCELITTCFDDWLDDVTMQSCDDGATSDLVSERRRSNVRWFYAQHFALAAMARKNAELHRRLQSKFSWKEIYYTPGLGVLPRYWDALGSRRLRNTVDCVSSMRAPKQLAILSVCLRFLLTTTSLQRIADGGRALVFTSIRRLPINGDTKIGYIRLGTWAKLMAALQSRSLLPARILRRAIGKDVVIATTIHDYPGYLTQDDGEVEVFVDGFHPSNYPRTYLDQYGAGVFVTGDPLSCAWFTKHGRVVKSAPGFIQAKPMTIPDAKRPVQQVLLALNHAGDWSSLINRSDTDRLVAAFCRIASSFPNLRFVLRPHPTMTHSSHEGRGSRERIARHVGAVGLSNVVLSGASLEQDLSGSDLVVSEYSQVLIDAFKLGKLGLIVNVTKRRSFMRDFEDCGFPHVSTEAELALFLREIIGDVNAATERQAAAAKRYNVRFNQFMTQAGAKNHESSAGLGATELERSNGRRRDQEGYC